MPDNAGLRPTISNPEKRADKRTTLNADVNPPFGVPKSLRLML